MSEISRKRFDGAFANAAVDLGNEALGAALAGASLDAGRLDALDGKADGRVSGQQAIDDLYDEINRLDQQTAQLSSKQERAVWDALRGAAIAPRPISAQKGKELGAAAHRMVVKDKPRPGQMSRWAYEGKTTCENPSLSSPSYAGERVWKCNVFVGEAFQRVGLTFPLNAQNHYVTANLLPGQSPFFRPVAKLDDVRPGDLISVERADKESGHVEIVTGVGRGPKGMVVSITSAGAHEEGSSEGYVTADPLVTASRTNGGQATAVLGSEVFRVLRPMAPPTSAAERR